MSDDINLNLHPKQTLGLESASTEILFGGAKGGGKSHLLRAASIIWAASIPNLQVYLFRRTHPDLWRNHMMGPGSYYALFGPWIRQRLVYYNSHRGYWQLYNGSRIVLCHCQYSKDINDYQGAEIHVLMVDQLEQWEKNMYQFLRAQMRLGGLEVPESYRDLFPRALNGANPGGIGHNWVKADFVDPEPPMKIWKTPNSEGGLLRQYIPSLLEDNPTQLKNDPNYEARLEGLGSPALVKALRWGIWDIVAGGAIDDVWDPGVHILPAFRIPNNWIVERSLDWGSSKPYSVGWWARATGEAVRMADGSFRHFYPGTRIRVAEDYGWNGSPNEGCKRLAGEVARRILEIEKNLTFRFQIKPGPADASIFDSDNPIADDMARAGVRWLPADKRPGSRAAGLEKIRNMLKASCQSPMEEPGLFVFDTCRHFIRTVPTLPRDQKKADDVDTDAEDHVYDETRYALMTTTHHSQVEQSAR